MSNEQFAKSKRNYYDDNLPEWERNIDAYIGGTRIINKKYISKGEYESDKGYTDRIDYFTYYPNRIRAILNNITNNIYSEPITRTGIDNLINFLQPKSIDGNNISYDEFFRQCLTYTMICGEIFIVFESPVTDQLNVLNNQDIQQNNLKPFCYLRLPQQVLNIEKDLNGNIVQISFINGDNLIYYNELEYEIYGNTNKVSTDIKNKSWEFISGGTHSFGRVPVVQSYIDIDDDGIADSIITDAVIANIVLANLQSRKYKDYKDNTDEIMWLPWDDKIADVVTSIYPKNALGKIDFTKKPIMPFVAGSQPSLSSKDLSYHSFMDTDIKSVKEDIQVMINQKLTELTKTSGLSKSYDYNNESMALSYLSNFCKQTELETWRLFSYLIKQPIEDIESVATIDYPVSFDIIDKQTEVKQINEAMLEMENGAARLMLEKEKFKTIMKSRSQTNLYNSIVDLYDKQIENQLDESINNDYALSRSAESVDNMEDIESETYNTNITNTTTNNEDIDNATN